MPTCEEIAVFPQFPGQPTCWFNAIVMVAMFSQHSRNMILANEDKWSTMSTAIKKLFKRFLCEKTRSTDHAFFVKMDPDSLLQHLHKENPREFYIHTATGHDTLLYLPRFYDFLGARKSIHFVANVVRGKVDMYVQGVNDETVLSQTEDGKFKQKLNFAKIWNHIFTKNEFRGEYDYFTLRVMSSPDLVLSALMKLSQFSMRRGAPVIKGVPLSTLISDDPFVLGDGRYVLDSVIWGSEISSLQCLRRLHAIAGVTCDSVRYVYNGYAMRHHPTHPLYTFDWVKDKSCIAVQGMWGKDGFVKCEDALSTKELRFRADQGIRTYIFVNERYASSASPPKQPSPRPSPRPSPKPSPRPSRPAKTLPACPPGKIRNPQTNRCVDIDGRIGKRILAHSQTHIHPGNSNETGLRNRRRRELPRGR